MSVLSLTELSDAFREEMEKAKNPGPECKGLIFRYSRDVWIGSDNDVNFRDRFRWNKTLSCDGCDKCLWMWDDLQEFMGDYSKGEGVMFDGVQDKLYQLMVTNISTDWESGHVDDSDLEFVKCEEPIHERNHQNNDVS